MFDECESLINATDILQENQTIRNHPRTNERITNASGHSKISISIEILLIQSMLLQY